ncbi:MAG: ABC transporter ATP-binding protein [Candidatus Aquicultorales bacterium]
MSAGITVDNLSFEYGDRRVLKSITACFEKGRFTSILGPNGSGKTTLLRSMSRLLKPAEGVVYIDGRAVASFKVKELARNMAVVPQETTHTFAFSAIEVVMMGRTAHLGRLQLEGKDDFSVVRRAMEATNTWPLRDRPVTELSGGEKQRVIIAQALAQEPKALLLDEPTLHLDLNHQLEVMSLLKQLNAGGLTVVAVLHDLNLAAYYSDTLVLVEEGYVRSVGPPGDVLTPRSIKEIFKADVLVEKHPVTGGVHITLLPKETKAAALDKEASWVE